MRNPFAYPFAEEQEYAAMVRQRELMLERKRFALQFAASDRVHRDEFHDRMRDEHLTRFTIDLFCKDTEHVEMLPEFSYPGDWWQAFKARWFPKWVLKRWPVRLTKVGGGWVKLNVQALFPELQHMGDRYKIFYRYEALERSGRA